MQALREGQPICFGTCEGYWLNFALSDAPIAFWRARSAEDLDEVNRMLADQVDYLHGLQTGLEKAKGSL